MNPLPFIQQWLNTFNYHDSSSMSRQDLFSWLVKQKPEIGNIDLAIDCLIAAGIGRDQEQHKTVYCRATYE